MPIDVSVLRLLQAIDEFTDRTPQDFPEDTLESVNNLKSSLVDYAPEVESPGHRAAVEASGQ